jgi:lipopolysaccharide transport system permease protein
VTETTNGRGLSGLPSEARSAREGSDAPAWPPHADAAPGLAPTVVIEARPETFVARLKALWRFRGFYGFLFKEITTRKARGTMLGLWWLIIRPVISAVAMIVVFASLKPLGTAEDVPYPVFFLSGFIPWRLFQSAVTQLPRSLMWMQGIMRRTYFPRLLVPLAAFGTTLIEFAVLWVVLAVAVGIIVAGGAPFPLDIRWETLWLLPCLLAALAFALAFGLVLSVVALFFREVVFTIRYIAQVFMFLTPVVYPPTFVPESYRWLLFTVNPMAQVVNVSRWALTGRGELDLPFLLLSFGMILVALALALAFFVRAEAQLGDQL